MRDAVLPADRVVIPDAYDLPLAPVRQRTLVWRRFRRHRLAVAAVWVLILMGVLAVIGPSLVPFGLTAHILDSNKGPRLWPLDLRRLMGNDDYGAAVSTYVFDGARPMLIIGILGSLIASAVGIVVGGIAGYFGRIVDTLLMRITDALLAIPFVPLLILLTLYLTDHGVLTYAILFGLAGWPGVARLVRGYVLSLRTREYADAARALGASDPVIIFRHLVPNALDVIVVSFTLNIAVFILAEVTLEFLAIPPDAITWGQGMAYAYRSGLLISNNAWWIAFFPGLPLLLTVLAVNFIGDGLRDALDTTSTTLVFEGAYRPGRTWRLLSWAARPALRGLAAGRAQVRARIAGLELARRRDRLAERVPWLRAGARSGRAGVLDRFSRAPLALRLLPPALVLLVCGAAFLVQHSPLRYAPHFPPPTTYAVTQGTEEYGAAPLPGGGWALLDVTPSGQLAFERTDASGRLLSRQIVPGTASTSTPSLALGAGTALGVWVSSDGTTVDAAYLGASGAPSSFAVTPSTGSIENPWAVAVPGGFDVLFTWQRPGDRSQQIWLALLRHGSRHPTLHLLIASKVHGFYPRAALDGSGALDVVWIDRTQPPRWAIRFRRFTPAGRPLSGVTTLDGFEYYIPGPPGTPPQINAEPRQWALDVQRAADGSVWAAWEGNQNLGGDWISVAQWTRTGHLTLPPTQVVLGGFDADVHSQRAVGLAITGSGGQLYYSGPNVDGGIGSVPYMQRFDRDGNPVGVQQRVAYDGGGTVANPHAAAVQGVPHAIWEKTALSNTVLEGTAYRAATIPASLLVRLGLNIGNLATNILFVILGALAGGIGIAAVNPILLFPLILLWLPLRWIVPRRLRWTVYLIAIGLILAWIFGSGNAPPAYVIFIGALGSPGGWIAVAAAIFTAFWAGQFIFRRFDALFRAAAVAATSVYVIGALYAVTYIQDQITKI